MNRDIVEGIWKQFKGKVKAQMGKFSDENLDAMFAKRLEVAGRVQEGYGITKDAAEQQIERLEERTRE